MTDDEAPIVIAGKRDDWPDGPRTLKPRTATRKPNGTLWFGAELDPSGDQVWFRIHEDAVGRMSDTTAEERGRRRLEALDAWIAADRPLKCGVNRFEVLVSENGDTWIERLRW